MKRTLICTNRSGRGLAGAGYLALAQIACEKQEYEEAFELIERSLAVP